MIPTGICTQTHRRPHLSDRERAEDLALWCKAMAAADFRETLWRQVAEIFARDLIRLETESAMAAAAAP